MPVGWVLAAFLALFGCSDDEERLSADEFRQQANDLCTEGADNLDALLEERFADIEGEPTLEQTEQFVAVASDELQDMVAELRELKPPEDMEADVEATLDSAESAIENMRDNTQELVDSDTDPFEETDAMFADLGLDACGGG